MIDGHARPTVTTVNIPKGTPNMRNTRTRARTGAFAVIASLSLLGAACGSDADDGDAIDAPAATEAGSDTTMGSETTMAPDTTMGGSDATMGGEGAMLEPSGPACSSVPDDGEGSFGGMADDPAATAASNNPELSTLVAAVDAAGLVDTLNGPGPFTIFAPANSAFEKIDAATLDALLADPTGDLTSILTLHIIGGEQMSSEDLAAAGSATTVNGEDITFEMDGDALMVNGQASVVCADVPTANATVHIIDSVLLPSAMAEAPTDTTMGGEGAMAPSGPACASVPADGEGSFTGMADDPAATAASNNPELSTLVTAVDAAGLVDTLNGPGPFTIFAPANSAFAALDPATLDAALADPQGLLTDVLALHVIQGEQLASTDLAGMTSLDAIGGSLTLAAEGDSLTVDAGGGAATVVCADIPTANATVHIIDTVLLPAG